MDSNTRLLYGGAISCRIPENFRDLSNILPLPDHQEVFIYQGDNKEDTSLEGRLDAYDIVLSFEILSHIEDRSEEAVARLLFEDLALCNEATQSEIYGCRASQLKTPIGINHTVTLLTGKMHVSKGVGRYKQDPKPITTFLYIVRIPAFKSDILITYNLPQPVTPLDYERELSSFEELASTLVILDHGLFTFKSS